MTVDGDEVGQFSLLAWESSLHDQQIYLGCTIKEHQKLQEVNLNRLLKQKRIKFLLNSSGGSCSRSLELISSILARHTFSHTCWNIFVRRCLIIHLNV